MSQTPNPSNPRRQRRTTKRKAATPRPAAHIKTTDVTIVSTPVTVSTTHMKRQYIQLMDDLAFLMRKRKDPMRARAYTQAKETMESQSDVSGPEALKGLPGIGPTIYQKLVTFTETGTLPILEEHAEDLRIKRAMDVFTQIYGVGEKKAEELVQKGVTTLEELTARKYELLNDKQQIGLTYYQDILERIPRAEIDEYKSRFAAAATAGMQMEIVGSYRRGAAHSGDIDVILTSVQPEYFKRFIDTLKAQKLIVEVLSCGNAKCLVIARLGPERRARRVDFLYTTPQEYPFALLYFTGSKGFNTAMREHALKQSYTLNEHGMAHMEGRKKGAAVDRVFADEAAVFAFLGLMYKSPSERQNADAVVMAGSEPTVAAATEAPSAPKKRRITKKKPPSPAPPSRPPPLSPLPPSLPNDLCSSDVAASAFLRIPSGHSPEGLSSPAQNTVIPVEAPQAPTPSTPLAHIHQFQQEGVGVLAKLTEPQLGAMIQHANHAFHTLGEPVMTDAEYDILTRYVEERFPTSEAVLAVGAAPVAVAKNKVKLPYEMASMDKIKPDTAALVQWKTRYPGPYVLSSKLDGVSGLYSTERTETAAPRLYTRGDGKVGQDISYLIPYLNLPKMPDAVVRGEFVFKKHVFATKYADTYANARNLVAGLVNGKTVDDRIRDVDFVAYEVIRPEKLTPSQQMAWLSEHGFQTVKHQTIAAANLTNEKLSEYLRDARTVEVYDIDGIIVSDDHVYPRISGNPDHSFAFKMVLSDQAAETHVTDVEWVASKDGFLKPTIHVEPVTIGGVTIRKTTGFNADFIEKHRIGIGAIVRIIRSGDVIPYVQTVVQPATQAKMPAVPYVWTKTHIDVVLENATEDADVRKKRIVAFFKTMEVDGLREGNVQKIVQAGYDTICKIVRMTESDMLRVEGFQTKTAQKLVTGIRDAISRAPLPVLVVASGTMGRGIGDKKIEAIFEAYPTWLEERDVKRLALIKGMSYTTAQELVTRIPAFMAFLEECRIPFTAGTGAREAAKPPPAIHAATEPLRNQTIVMTGVRSKALETALKPLGVKFGASVSKNTMAVIVAAKPDTGVKMTGKMKDAHDLGIPMYTLTEFQQKYQINV